MPLVEAIRAHAFAAERLHADDTTVPVLAKEKTPIARLWAYIRTCRSAAGHGQRRRSFTHPTAAVRIPSGIWRRSRA
jgi:hypothetical protein